MLTTDAHTCYGKSMSSQKILIIDNDETSANTFAESLKTDGFTVVIAQDGATGLEKVKSEKPDLILLGQVLPDVPGNEVLKKLQEDPDTKAIPVACFSNFGQNELVEEALACGAADYIIKYQIAPKDLSERIKGLLKQTSPGTPST